MQPVAGDVAGSRHPRRRPRGRPSSLQADGSSRNCVPAPNRPGSGVGGSAWRAAS